MIHQAAASSSVPPTAIPPNSAWNRLTQLVQRILRGFQVLYARCQLEWLGPKLQKQRNFALQQDSAHIPELQNYYNKWRFYTRRSQIWHGPNIGPKHLPPEAQNLNQLKTFYHDLKAFLDQPKT